MTDPTITIAGLRAQVATLIDHLDSANTSRGEFSSLYSQHSAKVAAAESERDALAAQLAEVRAKLDAAPKVCAIHSYEHGPGPCMTCGAWPPGTRDLIAACQTRIAGLESAANERSAEVARLTARVAELEARPVLTEERLRGALFACTDWASDAEVRAILAALGPVTLPAQDRAEELIAAYVDAFAAGYEAEGNPAHMDRWHEVSEKRRQFAIRTMATTLAKLGAPPTSPPAVIEMRLCEAGRVVLRPGTLYRFTADDGCEACRDATATSPPAARPVFAGVSEEELYRVYADAYGEPAGHVDDRRPIAIRAVLARLKVSLVAPVDPEEVARAIVNEIICSGTLSVAAAKSHARRAITARGIPVTPEVEK